jgi:formylmethanofuran:tetrahydromethanopterin formyltransferase
MRLIPLAAPKSQTACMPTRIALSISSLVRPSLGKNLRYFGDGFQIAKKIAGKRYWRVPVMDGEFLTEATTGRVDAVGGGKMRLIPLAAPKSQTACMPTRIALSISSLVRPSITIL